MNKIIFITKSLDINCIDGCSIDSSSALFERGIVDALNRRINVNVIYLGVSDFDCVSVGGVSFFSINYKSVFGVILLIRKIFIIGGYGFNILTTGYYPLETIVVVFLSKIMGGRSFFYIYDTHRQASNKMPMVKKFLVNIYFAIGFYFVQKSSGLFVLNDSFIKKKAIKIPFLKTKVGVEFNFRELKSRCSCKNKIIFIFAGTINSENGVDLLINFLSRNKSIEFELHFYGSGDKLFVVQNLELIDNRVKCFGRIPDNLLQEKLENADFLINLRDPCGVSVDYSFPSKLIKFMATGTPVISNKFPGLDESYEKHLYVIDAYTEKALSEMIDNLLKINSSRIFGIAAKKFISKENNWSKISEDVIKFMS